MNAMKAMKAMKAMIAMIAKELSAWRCSLRFLNRSWKTEQNFRIEILKFKFESERLSSRGVRSKI